MTRLPFQSGCATTWLTILPFRRQMRAQKLRLLRPPGTLSIAPERFGHELRLEAQLSGEELEEQFRQPRERDGIGAAYL